jgi:hypothetical protein
MIAVVGDAVEPAADRLDHPARGGVRLVAGD